MTGIEAFYIFKTKEEDYVPRNLPEKFLHQCFAIGMVSWTKEKPSMQSSFRIGDGAMQQMNFVI